MAAPYPYLYLYRSAVRSGSLFAQSSGSLLGTVTDSTGATIPGASVTIRNAISGLNREVKTDTAGHYQFSNLPPNPYTVTVAAAGFTTATLSTQIRSVVPVTLSLRCW